MRAHGPDSYDFSHGKLRDAVYEQLSPAHRRRNHQRMAEALRAAGGPGQVKAQVAAHYEQAEMLEPAVEWYERAATVAQGMHASAAAVRPPTRAPEPVEPARDAGA